MKQMYKPFRILSIVFGFLLLLPGVKSVLRKVITFFKAYKATSQENKFVKFNQTSNILKPAFIKISFLLCFSMLAVTSVTKVFAGTIVTLGNGNWSSTVPGLPWPGGVIPAAGDDIIIGDRFTLTVDENRTCKSIGFGNRSANFGAGTLIVNSGFQLTVTTAISVPSADFIAKQDATYNISGLGTISCATFNCNNLMEPSASARSEI